MNFSCFRQERQLHGAFRSDGFAVSAHVERYGSFQKSRRLSTFRRLLSGQSGHPGPRFVSHHARRPISYRHNVHRLFTFVCWTITGQPDRMLGWLGPFWRPWLTILYRLQHPGQTGFYPQARSVFVYASRWFFYGQHAAQITKVITFIHQ